MIKLFKISTYQTLLFTKILHHDEQTYTILIFFNIKNIKTFNGTKRFPIMMRILEFFDTTLY
jgi:hypothetical protein